MIINWKHLPIISMLFVELSLTATANVVGWEKHDLATGNNRIEINFDAINPLFSTLDKILQFDPPQNIEGDELEVILDGKVRQYAFESFDGTNHVLKTLGREMPEPIGLDAFPWSPVVWIKHRNGKPIALKTSGEVAGVYGKIAYRRTLPDDGRQSAFIVSLVDDDDASKGVSLKLEGGHIRPTEAEPPHPHTSAESRPSGSP